MRSFLTWNKARKAILLSDSSSAAINQGKWGRECSHTFISKKFHHFPGLSKNVFFQNRSPLTFKYNDKQQLLTVHA